jgi:hypothetical protein
MRPWQPRIGLVVLAALLIAGCDGSTPSEVETYREPDGRFSLDHPAGWHLTTARAGGVAHWRFTPEALADASAESPREISIAIIPLPEDLELNSASLEQVAMYVRDATIETAAEVGQKYRAGAPIPGQVGDREASRFNMGGIDAAGVEHRLAIVVVRHEDSAVVMSFGCPESEAGTTLPLLERCAETLRIASPGR